MCSHTFTWHGVVPPTHCPRCGACLHCGSPVPPPVPAIPYPTPAVPNPWPWSGPYYTGDPPYNPNYGTFC